MKTTIEDPKNMEKLVEQGFSEQVLSKASKAFNKWNAETTFPGA